MRGCIGHALILLAPFLGGCADTREAFTGLRDSVRPAFAVSPSGYAVIDLGGLGGANGSAIDINEVGHVVGWAETGSGDVHAFLWSDGVMTDLGALDGGRSEAHDVNSIGQVVGLSATSSGFRAFFWDGAMHEVGLAGYPESFPGNRLRGVCGTKIINNRGEILGTARGPTALRAFLWRDGAAIDLGDLGGGFSEAAALNEAGQVVGRSRTASGEIHAFLWSDGVMVDLGTFGGTFSQAMDINETGLVTGVSEKADGARAFVLWQAGVSMTELALPTVLGGLLVNDAGDVLDGGLCGGTIRISPQFASILSRGTVQLIAADGAVLSVPYSLNETGSVAGEYREELKGGGRPCVHLERRSHAGSGVPRKKLSP